MCELFLHRPRSGQAVRRRRRGAPAFQSHRLGSGCAAAFAAAVAAGGGVAQCGAGLFRSAICSRSARPSRAACPARRPPTPPGIIMGAGVRDWSKSGHAADAFDAKGAMLAALEAAMGGAHDRAGHGGRARPGFIPAAAAPSRWGPKQLAHFGELHPKILAAFDIKIAGGGIRDHSRRHARTQSQEAKRAICRPRLSRRSSAISPLWWMRKRGGGRDRSAP